MMARLLKSINDISRIVGLIIRGDDEALRRLTLLGGSTQIPSELACLCEQIAHLALQNEAGKLRLETMIEDLLSARAQLEKANNDPLTGLPNRTIFHQHMEKICVPGGGRIALLFIDLDRFKRVNDRFGHDAGDEVLQMVAMRMKAELRESDLLARLGGDEFAAILGPGVTDSATEQVAHRLVQTLSTPFALPGGDQAEIGCSIGIAFFPDHAESPIKLLKNADIAMYVAKENGRNQAVRFDQQLAMPNRNPRQNDCTPV